MGCLLPLDFVIPYLFRRLPMAIWRTDAHVIRNAGGRASDDAIRSLVIGYKLLGTREFFVVHHTDCWMEFFTNEVMRGLLASSPSSSQNGRETD
jgi:carbonic anhydrase